MSLMKRFFLLIAASLIISVCAPASQAQDLKDILSGLSKKSDTGKDSEKSGKSIGDMLSGLGNALGISSGKIEIKDLAGEWEYVAPAVTFKSDNFLLKAGGAAAATQVENKLEPYYKAAGINSLKITINEDSTFTFRQRITSVSGTLSKNPETGNYVFTFKALKRIKIGEMEGFIVKNGDRMNLTFDVSKLMTMMEKVSKFTKSSSISTMTKLLNQYDGITAGYQLKRTATAATNKK